MCQGHKNMNIMYKNQCSMTKIGFKLTISPFDYQIFTAPLTEPLRVDFKANGCVVSLKGCAEDPNLPVERVEDQARLALLGNSICVTLLEAFMWNDKLLYPAVTEGTEQ
jgi:hypothetical protein